MGASNYTGVVENGDFQCIGDNAKKIINHDIA